MTRNTVGIIISIIALVLSIAAFCIGGNVSSTHPLEWLIGILSVLVTVLIGWNIYSIIDIRMIRKQVLTERNQVHVAAENTLVQVYMGLSDYFYNVLGHDVIPRDEKMYKYIFYRISSILHASRIGDFNTCDVVIKALLETVKTTGISLTAGDKKSLLALLSFVENSKSIERYVDLLQFCASIPVRDHTSGKI